MKKFFEISFITFFASVIISIASGYCTVAGVGNIFTSAPEMAMIIAGVIEFGRIVLVYDLHHFWHQMPIIKKLPGITMLLIAMSLSALGVFGFFANAYSAKTKEVIPIELEIKQLESGIPLLESEIELNNKQIADLQKTMNSSSMDKAIDTYIEKEYVTKALNVKKDMQKQVSALMKDNKALNQKIIDIRKEVSEKQIEAESKAPTIAHLKYLAALLHTTNDNAIIIFIVMIMMVFDTLAMYLMITSDWIKIVTGQYEEPIKKVVKSIVYQPVKKEEKIILQEEPKSVIITPEEKKEVKSEPEKVVVKDVKPEISSKPIDEVNREGEMAKNNIDLKVSKLVQLLNEDKSIIDKASFIKSLSMTPLVVEKLEEELGKDNEIMKKIRAKLKK